MRFSDNVHILNQEFSLPLAPHCKVPRNVNMYLIEGKKLYLVDCGTKASFQLIKAYLKTIGRDLAELDAVFLTHSHPDHIGSLKLLQAATNCKVYMHVDEKKWVEDVELQFKNRPVPGFYQMVAGSATVTNLIHSDQVLVLEDGLKMRALHTPGHSVGSVCYHLQSNNCLFSGDAVLLPGELPIYNNVEEYHQSIDKIGDLPSTTTILSAFDIPKSGAEFAKILSGSVAYIDGIGDMARNRENVLRENGELAFCKAVVSDLGMPSELVNPLLLQSFLAHLN